MNKPLAADLEERFLELCDRDARLTAYLWKHFPEERQLAMDPVAVVIALLERLKNTKPNEVTHVHGNVDRHRTA